MLRGILPILSAGVILVGGVLLAHGDDKDDKDNKDKNGNKKQHQAILNAVNSGNAQHNTLLGQVTTHDAAQTAHDGAQTTQHNTLSGEVTTHDGAQTSQHDDLSQQISNLSTGGDHSGLPPAWDKILSANDPGGACPSNSSWFTCVMGGAAVRDNETGLVWEQSKDATLRTWFGAIFHCAQREVGGRKGWHLPLREQLASLVDSSNAEPALPTGHPFTISIVQSPVYWSVSTNADVPIGAWSVDFSHGVVDAEGKAGADHAWCMRGGQSFDGNTHATLH